MPLSKTHYMRSMTVIAAKLTPYTTNRPQVKIHRLTNTSAQGKTPLLRWRIIGGKKSLYPRNILHTKDRSSTSPRKINVRKVVAFAASTSQGIATYWLNETQHQNFQHRTGQAVKRRNLRRPRSIKFSWNTLSNMRKPSGQNPSYLCQGMTDRPASA